MNNSGSLMDKRVYKRIPTNLRAVLFCGEDSYNATVTNCSENGLCINIDNYLPCDLNVKLFMPIVKDVLRLNARTCRLEKTDDTHFTIGVELTEPPVQYKYYLDGLRFS
jgi:hypothetical protein